MQGILSIRPSTLPARITVASRFRALGSLVCLVVILALGLGLLGCDGQKSTTVADDGAAKTDEAAPTPAPAPEPEAGSETGDGEAAVTDTDGADAQAAVAEPPVVEAPTEPQTILILGDSLAATGFGVILAKRLDAHPMVTAYRKGKSASGLARPDFFDWMAEGRRQVDLRQPDVVVVIMGGNDGQDLTTTNGKGRRVRWDSEEWSEAYGVRMTEFLEAVSAPGRKVVWLGLPKMGMNSLERKLVTIREIQAAQLANMGDAGLYLETTPHLVDESGELLRLARVRGKNLTIREDDGIHFTMSGSQYLVDRIYPEILKAMGLTPVQDEG